MAKRYVFNFGGRRADGSARKKSTLGGKGANLAEMTNIGIPVPPGFTISSELCIEYIKRGRLARRVIQEIDKAIARLERLVGKKFGDPTNPLLVSVRSGARVSMPGMMDTILNLGLNNQSVKGLIKLTNDKRFAYDCYRRLIQMYCDVVLDIPRVKFEKIIEERKKRRHLKFDIDLTGRDWEEIIRRFKRIARGFPQDPREQLMGAIGAVFNSWNTPRAIEYRRIYNIPSDWGTAVNVQVMVFGNTGKKSATGVVFTRDPATGAKKIYGEFLPNAQGEDVVAGIRTPQKIERLRRIQPQAYNELVRILKKLERHYRDVQDVEFTIEAGKLWILQTRVGKRTARAAIKIAVDMVKENLISKKVAVMRIRPEDIDQLLHPMIDPTQKLKPIAKGLPASPGAAVGSVVFEADDAIAKAKKGQVILVRNETSADDVGGMKVSQGFLTARGGMTSHAAVVARGMGKPCIVGCDDIKINYQKRSFQVGDLTIREGDQITVDGTEGTVYKGPLKLIEPRMTREAITLLKWADSFRRLKIRANADTGPDSKTARDFGAEGIGLCRTEHMFFARDRIQAMREMIIAKDEEGRQKALDKLLPFQKEDFKQIFRAMDGLPVTIRTLDPPLHEFLPRERDEIEALAEAMNIPVDDLMMVVNSLDEANPMLGHRGCRLGITYPEITEMQTRAIIEAACEVKKEGVKVLPEIMIPVVAEVNEFKNQKEVVVRVANETMRRYGLKIKYLVGTMIEIPRAAITADQIAREAEFFSYGTNDLTQTSFGFSRDDIAKFLPFYIESRILSHDPFQSIDIPGVGYLVEIGVKRGRKTKPDLKIGICGEHGGEPRSIAFCHKVGLDYVSCSPYRVPIARLAAAHIAIESKRQK
ncbi:MAG TPA: pyruvate, phosphate dikinase [bacterium (Candidatus Stahlbacteria)]|nr:pyruvate, phosphate dikinase [Candidatus Stahlbacteria bacterium]